VPINHIRPNKQVNWEKYKEKLRRYIINRLENSGMKNFEKNIKFEISLLPTDWKNYLNLTYGAVYGLDHNLMQLGYLRPKRQHAKYKNLFFVGASNHPGSGLPTVLLSSQFTCQKVLQAAGLS
jgi:phytoene dehydrogenase-like protein